MRAAFADPKTSVVFKRIFGAEARRLLLATLLNHLLELEGDRRIVDLVHLSRAERVGIPELKLSIVDVKCTDATGRRFVVEVQVLKVEGFEKRVVHDASKPYVMQLRHADGYPPLCEVVGVTICNFNLWPDTAASGRYKVPMLSRWRMQEQHTCERGLPQISYVFLELPKYAGGDAPASLIDKWAYFFREATDHDVVPPALADLPILEALEVARIATFTPAEWDAYDRAKMAEQDARGALTVARAEGKIEGRLESKIEGERVGELRGKRAALLRVLARVDLEPASEDLARIEACTDAASLDRWLDNAIGATSMAQVLALT